MRFMQDPKRFLRFYEGFRFQKFAAYVGNFFHTIQRKKPGQEAPQTQTPYSGHIYEDRTPRFGDVSGQQTYEQIDQREFQGHMSQTPRPSTHSLWTRIRMSEAQEGHEAPDVSPIDMAIDMAKSGDLDDTEDTEPEDDEMGSLEDVFQPTDALLDNEFYDHSIDDLAEYYEQVDDDMPEDDAQDQMEDQEPEEPEDPDDEPPDDPAMGPGGFPFAPGG
ncbi:hypothetical protein ACFL6S_31135 [Candidatus Poribacteria bacterium]